MSINILIFDAEEQIRKVIEHLLEPDGYVFFHAEKSKTVAEVALGFVDLAIIDVCLINEAFKAVLTKA